MDLEHGDCLEGFGIKYVCMSVQIDQRRKSDEMMGIDNSRG